MAKENHKDESWHHCELPDFSTLLSGAIPPNKLGFKSSHLQIWYNKSDKSWVGEGEQPHKHLQSDECFIVLRGELVIEVNETRFTVGPREFCCFPAGQYHAIVEVHPPVEALMIRAPSVEDKIYLDDVSEYNFDYRKAKVNRFAPKEDEVD